MIFNVFVKNVTNMCFILFKEWKCKDKIINNQ